MNDEERKRKRIKRVARLNKPIYEKLDVVDEHFDMCEDTVNFLHAQSEQAETQEECFALALRSQYEIRSMAQLNRLRRRLIAAITQA
jgi:hypothetical protein